MLPFLSKPKSLGGTIVEKRTPDVPKPDSIDPIEPFVSDLIDAIQSNDLSKAVQALRDAFSAMEMQPHQEISHEDESQES